MPVVINTNLESLMIRNNLSTATSRMSKAMQRMTTGLKLNSAKDDAAGTIIAAKMLLQMDGNQIAQHNVQNANAMLSTVEGNLDVTEENLSRIRDLTLQAKNGTYSSVEIEAMQKEVAQRIEELNRISESSTYSSIYLFCDEDIQEKGVSFQVGASKESNNTIKADGKIFDYVDFEYLTKLENYDVTTLSTAEMFENALGKIDIGIDNVTSRKSLIGSAQSRLDSALNSLTIQHENLANARSIITDADIAAEASEYMKESILQQVASSLMAQANQAPSIALSLI